MVSQRERERLTEAFKREPLGGAAVVFKCVAGLMVVAGLAVMGAQTEPTDATATIGSEPPSQGYQKASMAYGTTLFQERQTLLEPGQLGVAIQILSANAAETHHAHRISSLTRRGATAPENSLQN
jgi:hypothetical protein